MSKGKSDLALPIGEFEDYGRRLRSLRTRLDHTKKLFQSYEDDLGDSSLHDALADMSDGVKVKHETKGSGSGSGT
jgi:hypothetical protein